MYQFDNESQVPGLAGSPETVAMGTWTPQGYTVSLQGDAQTASLLSRIVYWYQLDEYKRPKLHVKRDDVYWLGRSHVEWTEEIGLTRRQTHRCINRLEALGILETRLMKGGGDTKLHVRLRYAKGASSLAGYPPFQSLCTGEG